MSGDSPDRPVGCGDRGERFSGMSRPPGWPHRPASCSF